MLQQRISIKDNNAEAALFRRRAMVAMGGVFVLTLMLLWRKGIILLHDTQPKAANALPGLFRSLQTSPVRWVDCRTFADH